MEKQMELQNTIPQRSDNDYETLEEGDHLMGLVLIKNKEVKNNQTGEVFPGFQLSFRSKDNPKGWVNRKFKASTSEKSTMFKMLKVMTKGKVKKDTTREEMFTLMVGCLGQWFDVTIEHAEWQERVFANITGELVIPNSTANKELGNAIAYFDLRDDEVSAPNF